MWCQNGTDEGESMSSKADEYRAALSEEDEQALIEALREWRRAGVTNPRIPIGEDLTEDGLTDAWALDKDENLVVKQSVTLRRTVYVSDGSGEEAEGGEPE
jgi:hypothetical protein